MRAVAGSIRGIVLRAREGHARHGTKGFVREAVGHASQLVRLREEHYWYEFRLAELSPSPSLAPPLRLVAASEEQFALVAEFGKSVADARQRARAGDEQLLLFDGDELAFGCCILHREARVLAARRHRLALPEHTVCLEEAYTKPSYRRRKLASTAVLAVLERLRAQGTKSVIMKVAAENAGPRAGLLELGAHEIARMRFQRLGPRRRVEFDVLDDEQTAAELARRMG